nr:hypothetical protein [Tanacetum cinerariifolium]
MRLYKSAAEVKVMREAAQISARAHVRAMQASRADLRAFGAVAADQPPRRAHPADSGVRQGPLRRSETVLDAGRRTRAGLRRRERLARPMPVAGAG